MSNWKEFSVSPIIGPYVDWVRDPGAAYTPDYLEFDRIACVIELEGEASLKDAIKFLDNLPVKPNKKSLNSNPRFDISKDLFNDSQSFVPTGRFLTGFANQTFLAFVEENKAVSKIVKRLIVAQKLADDVYCSDGGVVDKHEKKDRKPKPCKGTVVTGVIDEGIAFGHENFRQSNTQTRVEFAWIQDAKCRKLKAGVSYGREHRKGNWVDRSGAQLDGIDSILANSLVASQVDEDLFYNKVGLTNYARAGHKAIARRTAHGTHVMDLACGYKMGHSPIDRGSKSPCFGFDQRPIVCVQLPSRTVADTSGLGLEKYMLDGVIYILQKADEIAKRRNCEALPVVINFSSAVLAGPHDGTHPIETRIEELLRARRKKYPGVATEMVLPAGNSYLSKAHAKIKLVKKKSAQLTWRLQPDDKTYNYMEIWLPQEEKTQKGNQPKKPINNAITLQITTPCGEVCRHFGGGHNNQAFKWEPDGAGKGIVCKAYYEFIEGTGSEPGRGRFTIITLATAHHDAPTRLAPSGNWQLEFMNHTTEMQPIHAWIQWDDRPLSYPISGRQSYFIDSEYDDFDPVTGRRPENDKPNSVVKRHGTINAIGTGKSTITIAGFFNNELRPVSYSAAGEGVGIIAKPLASVVSDDSVVHAGILAAGSRSGSVVIMNGTSVAAPQVARWLADQLANNSNLPTPSEHQSIGQLLVKEQAKIDEQNMKDPQHKKGVVSPSLSARIGNGRMDIYNKGLTTSQRLRQSEGAIN